jgi:hypothetical protein
MLKTGACGPPAVSTVWETQTKLTTSEVEQTITVVETASPTCAAAAISKPPALSGGPPGPKGKALVTVDDGGQTEDGRNILVLRVYMNYD